MTAQPDTFRVIITEPADDSLFRKATMVYLTPSGSVQKAPDIATSVWRTWGTDQDVRTYAENYLISKMSHRERTCHGSRVAYRYEGAGTITIIEVDFDVFDAVHQFRPYEPICICDAPHESTACPSHPTCQGKHVESSIPSYGERPSGGMV